jgi:hypothetical protein
MSSRLSSAHVVYRFARNVLWRFGVFVALAALPITVHVLFKGQRLRNPMHEVFLRAVLVYAGLVISAVHLATSLVIAAIWRYRGRPRPCVAEFVIVLAFIIFAVLCGYNSTITVPPPNVAFTHEDGNSLERTR